MNNFISEDKKQINLPLAIGTIVYESKTKCSDVCTFQKDLTNKNRNLIKCDKKAICHTRARQPIPREITLNNIEWLINNWNDTIFETELEADNYTKNLVVENIIKMKRLGFKLREDGYSITPNEDKSEEKQNNSTNVNGSIGGLMVKKMIEQYENSRK